jgi:hypothetical protein
MGFRHARKNAVVFFLLLCYPRLATAARHIGTRTEIKFDPGA